MHGLVQIVASLPPCLPLSSFLVITTQEDLDAWFNPIVDALKVYARMGGDISDIKPVRPPLPPSLPPSLPSFPHYHAWKAFCLPPWNPPHLPPLPPSLPPPSPSSSLTPLSGQSPSGAWLWVRSSPTSDPVRAFLTTTPTKNRPCRNSVRASPSLPPSLPPSFPLSPPSLASLLAYLSIFTLLHIYLPFSLSLPPSLPPSLPRPPPLLPRGPERGEVPTHPPGFGDPQVTAWALQCSAGREGGREGGREEGISSTSTPSLTLASATPPPHLYLLYLAAVLHRA